MGELRRCELGPPQIEKRKNNGMHWLSVRSQSEHGHIELRYLMFNVVLLPSRHLRRKAGICTDAPTLTRAASQLSSYQDRKSRLQVAQVLCPPRSWNPSGCHGPDPDPWPNACPPALPITHLGTYLPKHLATCIPLHSRWISGSLDGCAIPFLDTYITAPTF